MVRTSFATGVIFPALAAVSACGEDGCPRDFESCNGLCVRLPSDPFNCGSCGVSCQANGVCRQGNCEPGCDTGQTACGATCVDVQIDSAHCGGCDAACPNGAPCMSGQCVVPLAVLRTSVDNREIDRDIYVLENVTLDLTKLDQATFATNRVIDHAILPDGSVVIVAAETTEETFELYRVAAGGGPLTKLNAPLPAGANVQAGVAVSRDGKSLLYRADQDTAGVIELYLVKLATPGTATKVNGPLVANGNVSRVFAISADGSRVTYIADQDTDGVDELYTTTLPTPNVKKVNPAAVSSVFDFQASDDGSVVVYRMGDPSTGSPLLNVASTATPGVADPILTPDGLNGAVYNYQVARDGSAVIFSSTQGFLSESLYRAPLVSPFSPTRFVDGSMGGVRSDFVVTSNGARVFFRQADPEGVKRLYRVDVANPASRTQLSPAGNTFDAVVPDFALSRDEKTLAFRTGADGPEGGFIRPGTDPPFFFDDKTQTIFAVDLTATTPAPVLLNPPFMAKNHEGVGAGYVITRDGRVLYRADHDTPGRAEAYLSDKASPRESRKVSPDLAPTDATDVSVLSSF
ncbi:MAG: hypothetical protein KIT31_26810 [Deltaproteobacteria bacterium]|nr:hypothetical protein [Deltaproteobacteria bacterium]